MKELFVFTIGPVQGFIAQSRKTRDLYAGSMILSSIIKTCIERLKAQTEAEIVYPHYHNTAQSMPNKFMAMLSLGGKTKEEIGQDIETIARNQFLTLANDTKLDMRLTSIGSTFDAQYEAQINSHLEVYWAFEEIMGDDYALAHQRINRKLASLKNFRPFAQLPDDEKNRKCSITGERDALVFGHGYTYGNQQGVPAFVNQQKIALSKTNDVQLDKGEGLSAIMALKRFNNSASFPSTAEIAAYDFIHCIESLPVQDELRLAWDRFKLFDSDGQLLFKENYDVQYLERNGYMAQIGNLDQLKQAFNALRLAAKKAQVNMPSPYYAIIQFDGDKMGPTWSGQQLGHTSRLKNFQVSLAQQLHQFAESSKQCLSKPKGKSVYAGGDDFLGFLNLNYLFKVLSTLRNNYRTEVYQRIQNQLKPGSNELSFSAGIVIAHYKTPLTEVLSAARTTQAIAKDEAGRNAFAVTLLKRSGEIQQAHLKWGDNFENIGLIERITQALQVEDYSNTFIKSLEVELSSLTGRMASTEALVGFRPLVHHEITRLVKRSKMSNRDNDNMATDVKSLFDNADTVENFLHWLHIADFLHRKPE
jgi:CRISPR-associated protein Cmr2